MNKENYAMNPIEKIAVIGAMDIEIAYLVSQLENKTETELFGYTFYSGMLCGRQVTILKCGVGKVNAARGTQLVIDRFAPDAVLNTGIAGGLDPALQVGDAVVAGGLVQHDFNVTAFGHARGYLCTGVDHDMPTVFTPDPALSAVLRQAAVGVLGEKAVMDGIIATGDMFVAGADTRRKIRETFHAAAAEMESAAIAQTAAYAGVPFAILRVISDRADGSATETYDQFERKAAKCSASIIEEFLRQL
jgi:adenosylhomocysteine nucleosidase